MLSPSLESEVKWLCRLRRARMTGQPVSVVANTLDSPILGHLLLVSHRNKHTQFVGCSRLGEELQGS